MIKLKITPLSWNVNVIGHVIRHRICPNQKKKNYNELPGPEPPKGSHPCGPPLLPQDRMAAKYTEVLRGIPAASAGCPKMSSSAKMVRILGRIWEEKSQVRNLGNGVS